MAGESLDSGSIQVNRELGPRMEHFYAGFTVKISSRSHHGPFISERYDWNRSKEAMEAP